MITEPIKWISIKSSEHIHALKWKYISIPGFTELEKCGLIWIRLDCTRAGLFHDLIVPFVDHSRSGEHGLAQGADVNWNYYIPNLVLVPVYHHENERTASEKARTKKKKNKEIREWEKLRSRFDRRKLRKKNNMHAIGFREMWKSVRMCGIYWWRSTIKYHGNGKK